MTSVRAVALIFGIPVVLILGMLVFLGVGTRTPEVILPGSVITIGLAAWLLIAVRGGITREHNERAPRLQALAERFSGAVAVSFLGERQLHLPHPRGRVELDYRVHTRDGESHEPYTRVALVLPPGVVQRVRRDMFEKPSIEKKLGPRTRAEVTAVREATGAKVRLLGRGSAPSIELWAFGWLDAAEATRLIETAVPHLGALASHPWDE